MTHQEKASNVFASHDGTRLIRHGSPPEDPVVLANIRTALLATIGSDGADHWQKIDHCGAASQMFEALNQELAIFVVSENPLQRKRLISSCKFEEPTDLVAVKFNALSRERAADIVAAIDKYLEKLGRK